MMMVLLCIDGSRNVFHSDNFVVHAMRSVVRIVHYFLIIGTRFLKTGDAQDGNFLRQFRGSYLVMHLIGLLSLTGGIIKSLEARKVDPFTFQNCSNSFLFQNHPT